MIDTKDASDIEDNQTRAFIAAAVASGLADQPLDINPAFVSLSAVLQHGVPGEVVVRFTADAASTQGNGVVSGGTLASMLDCGIAVAVLSALKPGQTCSTISLAVNMQRGAGVGELRVEAKVDRLGRRVAYAQAQLFNADHQLIANATSALLVL